jgi:glycosyltransferase 2 family protein
MLGSPALYRQIETRLTELLGSADSLLLPTLTHIHASVIPVLASDGTVFVDARAHKTIWDGCVAARAHGATMVRYAHDDPEALERALHRHRKAPRLVCMDGLNSMTGNPPQLKRLLKVTAPPYLYSGPSPVASLASALVGLQVNEVRGDDLRTVLWARTRRILDHLDKLGAFTLSRSGFPISEMPLADPGDLARAGPRPAGRGRPPPERLAGRAPSSCASVSGVALPDRLADQPTSEGAPLPPPGGRWRTPLRLAVAGVLLAAVAVVLAGQWRQARPLLGRLSVPVVLAAWALVLAGIYATFRSWRAALADLGGRPPHAGGMRVFYVGQLGKYLPGTIWPAVTQMRLGRDYRVPPRASGAAVVVFMLMLIGTGLLVGVPVIPLLGRDAVDEYHWLVLVLPLLVLVLTPPVLNRVMAAVLRVARRPPLPAPLSLGGILRVAGWALVSWLCYGLHVYLLVRQLGVEGGALLWLQCTGAFAAAFASGPLLLVVPAGAGVREAALLLLLGSTVTAPVAAVVAVVSRLLFVVGDLAWAAVAVLAARRLVRPAGTLPRSW